MTATKFWPVDRQPNQGLGLMRLTDDGADDDRNPVSVVHAALDLGVALLDTAEMYGNEELVGRTIAGRREEVVLCTKFGVRRGESGRFDDWSVHADAASVISSCEGSLRRLGVDTIDLYYLHHRSEETPIEETVAAMVGLLDAGKIRGIGLSNVTTEDIRRAHMVHPIEAVQEAFSLSSRPSEAMLSTLGERGIALVAHSPTAHGALRQQVDSALGDALVQVAGKYAVDPGQIALAWVHEQGRRREQLVIPLPGTASVRHLHANASAATLRLEDADLDRLSESAAEISSP